MVVNGLLFTILVIPFGIITDVFSGIPLGFSPGSFVFFSGIVSGILPEIPLKIILVFLSGSIPSDIPESFESFQCSFKFFFRPKDSSGFEPGILLKFLPRFLSRFLPEPQKPPGIPSDSPSSISSAIFFGGILGVDGLLFIVLEIPFVYYYQDVFWNSSLRSAILQRFRKENSRSTFRRSSLGDSRNIRFLPVFLQVFFLSRGSPGFKPGVLGVSPEIFLKTFSGIPSGVDLRIPFGAPQCIFFPQFFLWFPLVRYFGR